jgi:hypothetical protein
MSQGGSQSTSSSESNSAANSQTGNIALNQSSTETIVADSSTSTQYSAVTTSTEQANGIDSTLGVASFTNSISEGAVAASTQGSAWTALASIVEANLTKEYSSQGVVLSLSSFESNVSADQSTVTAVFTVSALMSALTVDINSSALIKSSALSEPVYAVDLLDSSANLVAVYQDSNSSSEFTSFTYSDSVYEKNLSLDSIVVSKTFLSQLLEAASAYDLSTSISLTWRNSRLLSLSSVAHVLVQPVKITKISLNTLNSKIMDDH